MTPCFGPSTADWKKVYTGLVQRDGIFCITAEMYICLLSILQMVLEATGLQQALPTDAVQ